MKAAASSMHALLQPPISFEKSERPWIIGFLLRDELSFHM
jgi:hypothetical protein